MSFLFSSFLVFGAAALIIPIAIHWLLNTSARREPFSTVRFFTAFILKGVKPGRLDHLLVMFLRCLLFLLLLLAFASPFIPWPNVKKTAKDKSIVFVIDNSASMRAKVNGTAAWDLAVAKLRSELNGLQREAKAAVITLSPYPHAVCGLVSPEQALTAVAGLKPALDKGGLTPAIAVAAAMLEAESGSAGRIDVISDFQASDSSDMPGVALPEKVSLKQHRIAEEVRGNITVTAIERAVFPKDQLNVSMFCFGDSPKESLRLLVRAGEETIFEQEVKFGAWSGQTVRIPMQKQEAERMLIRAEIESNDAFPDDNIRYMVQDKLVPVRIFLIEGSTGRSLFRQQTYYLRTAFSVSHSRGPFTVDTLSVRELLSEAENNQGLIPADLVCLSDLPKYDRELVAGIKKFVEKGGICAVFLGNSTGESMLNDIWNNFLPADISRLDTPAVNTYWHIGEWDRKSGLFSAFKEAGLGDLALPRFYKRALLLPELRGSVIARFNDDVPLILSSKYGAGTVFMFNTSIDAQWSDWPKRKTFLPVLCGLADLVSSSIRKENTKTQDSLPPNMACEMTGFYDVTGNGKKVAVNIPAQESDLRAVEQAVFNDSISRSGQSGSANRSQGYIDLWTYVLLAVLLCSSLEVYIANRRSK